VDSCHLPFTIFTPAGFPVTGGPPPRPARSQRLLVLSGSHRRRTRRIQSVRLHTVFASGSFTRRLNASDSWGMRTGRKGGDRISIESDRRRPAGGERREVGQGGGTHG
jgi:hypothetical protein